MKTEKFADATVQANILQRIGGSLGSALFVVILEAHQPIDLAAFHGVLAWLTATAARALLAATGLARSQRHVAG